MYRTNFSKSGSRRVRHNQFLRLGSRRASKNNPNTHLICKYGWAGPEKRCTPTLLVQNTWFLTKFILPGSSLPGFSWWCFFWQGLFQSGLSWPGLIIFVLSSVALLSLMFERVLTSFLLMGPGGTVWQQREGGARGTVWWQLGVGAKRDELISWYCQFFWTKFLLAWRGGGLSVSSCRWG